VPPSGQKLILGLVATITHEPPFHEYALLPVLLPLFKINPGSRVLWGCFSTARNSASIFSIVSNGGFSVLSSTGEIEKNRRGPSQVSRGVGDDSHVMLVWKSVKTVWSFAQLHAVTVKRHNSMWKWLSGLPGDVLCEQFPDVKEYYEHALDLVLHLICLFHFRWVWTFPLRGLLLCLKVITINPALVTSVNPRQEGSIVAQNLMHTHCSFVGSV
jgi:hypothetical protein